MYQLTRFRADANGTFGKLTSGGELLAYTCEPYPPILNTGIHTCIPHNGAEFKDVWEITGIPSHTAILIHNGNTIKDTRGCVLVGSALGEINGAPAVIHSKATLDKLREILPDKFELTVE